MSFYTNYPNRKDWRKPYTGSKRFDSSCRNHGSCDYCKGNRTHKNVRNVPIVENEYKELAR